MVLPKLVIIRYTYESNNVRRLDPHTLKRSKHVIQLAFRIVSDSLAINTGVVLKVSSTNRFYKHRLHKHHGSQSWSKIKHLRKSNNGFLKIKNQCLTGALSGAVEKAVSGNRLFLGKRGWGVAAKFDINKGDNGLVLTPVKAEKYNY